MKTAKNKNSDFNWKNRHPKIDDLVTVYIRENGPFTGILMEDYNLDDPDHTFPQIRLKSGEIIGGNKCQWAPIGEDKLVCWQQLPDVSCEMASVSCTTIFGCQCGFENKPDDAPVLCLDDEWTCPECGETFIVATLPTIFQKVSPRMISF